MTSVPTASPGYCLDRLAEGTFDINLDGRPVAALVKSGDGWIVELFAAEGGSFPPPFTQPEHVFGSICKACEWLGLIAPDRRQPG